MKAIQPLKLDEQYAILEAMGSLNSHVLVSGAEFFSNDQPINPYYHQETIDITRAIEEHNTIVEMLKLAGITVDQCDPPSDSQDGVYTANWALVRGERAVLAHLPLARRAEEAYAKNILESLGKEIFYVPDGLKFSGQGDALPCGNLLFCGSGYRSDVAAQAFAAETLGYERIQLQTVPQLDEAGKAVINQSSGWPDSFYYDIDLALAIIKPPEDQKKGVIAYCPEAFTPESQDILEKLSTVEKIIVSEQEAKEGFACNLVSTGEAVIMSAHAPQLTAELKTRGLNVFTPEIRELAKGGGYIRCTTLTLNDELGAL